mmetsp:Transcript_8327/g.20355  ORF Transcript_8327/g.20355 Transcript_8327/m.20355 type:complete len:202 (-) Transcript_8327:263-868(-)
MNPTVAGRTHVSRHPHGRLVDLLARLGGPHILGVDAKVKILTQHLYALRPRVAVGDGPDAVASRPQGGKGLQGAVGKELQHVVTRIGPHLESLIHQKLWFISRLHGSLLECLLPQPREVCDDIGQPGVPLLLAPVDGTHEVVDRPVGLRQPPPHAGVFAVEIRLETVLGRVENGVRRPQSVIKVKGDDFDALRCVIRGRRR